MNEILPPKQHFDAVKEVTEISCEKLPLMQENQL